MQIATCEIVLKTCTHTHTHCWTSYIHKDEGVAQCLSYTSYILSKGFCTSASLLYIHAPPFSLFFFLNLAVLICFLSLSAVLLGLALQLLICHRCQSTTSATTTSHHHDEPTLPLAHIYSLFVCLSAFTSWRTRRDARASCGAFKWSSRFRCGTASG